MTAQYRIWNRFLPVGFTYDIIRDTLNIYERGEDMSDSPLIQWGRRVLEEGGWWYGIEKVLPRRRESGLRGRQKLVIDLYLDMKNNGYNDSVISIFFDNDGNVKVYDGFHRLSIMKYLGIEAILNCMISTREEDFPLVETVTEINGGRNLYQPCDDERLKRFHVWRKDSHKRLQFILRKTGGSTVLDIGCSEGFFSRELAKRGYKVTALDVGRRRLAIARYLSIIGSLDLEYHLGKWQLYIEDKRFDNVLFLSVFHHDILALGIEEAFKQLERFRGRTRRLFFESPISAKKITWTSAEQKNLYDFTEKEFKTRIEEATHMTAIETWHGIRPIFLLEA